MSTPEISQTNHRALPSAGADSAQRRAAPRTAVRLAAASSALLLMSVPHGAQAYNSQEHKIAADWGAGRVSIPPGVVLPAGVRLAKPDGYLSQWLAAKNLAVGFGQNEGDCIPPPICKPPVPTCCSPTGYDPQKSVQDNCYYNGYGQLYYNFGNFIYGSEQGGMPTTVLQVSAGIGTGNASLTFGDLVALYGDYRRSVACQSDQCWLTDGNAAELTFSGSSKAYCPAPISTTRYLQFIALGLWPPFGELGNAVSPSVGPAVYDDVAWWGDEMMRIAYVNDWHFSNVALAWYVGMHRLALLAVQEAIDDPTAWVKALHYEASALHSLTDLFALGHMVTNRDQSSYCVVATNNEDKSTTYQWMENVIQMGGGSRTTSGNCTLSTDYPGKVEFSSPVQLPALKDLSTSRVDYMNTGNGGTWNSWVETEHTYHQSFNLGGAAVKNLAGDEFDILGDGSLVKKLASQTQIEKTVTASLNVLFGAFVALKEGKTVEQIGAPGSDYFAALRYIPVFISTAPSGKGNYFMGRWTRYAEAVNEISGAGYQLPGWPNCQVSFLSGADWHDPFWPSDSTPCANFSPSTTPKGANAPAPAVGKP